MWVFLCLGTEQDSETATYANKVLSRMHLIKSAVFGFFCSPDKLQKNLEA